RFFLLDRNSVQFNFTIGVQFNFTIGAKLIFASFLDHYFIFCKRFQSFLHEKSRQMPALLHTS
ncbi:hypothetical protein, partial [Lactobacillus delbrueckii]|uniref:hypothetical protein n=1 Tax=Lactobacillus delbrueckii TaxID=1584 RepID=UPI001C6FDBC5